MPEITITGLVARSHGLALQKGWYETWPDGTAKVTAINVPEKLALIHSEVSEALEEFRSHGVRVRCSDCNGTGSIEADSCGCYGGFHEFYFGDGRKPEGFVVELADAVIRIADLCGALGLDLAAAIEIKHAYNESRPFRHGGKRA